MIKKIILLVFVLVVLLVDASLIVLKLISSATNRPLFYFPQLLLEAQNQPSSLSNFLILGLDPRNDALEKTQVTDTIIFAHLNHTPRLQLFSLPRDLWSYPLNTKINQIYPRSLSEPQPFKYIQDNFQSIIGQPLDRTIIITTQNLIDLTQLLGGVEVYLDTGFTDHQYPNPEYIKHPSPTTPIYITVTYPQGWNHLTAANITPFVRSRHNADTAAAGGTDLGRIRRQQLLIDALISRLKSVREPTRIIALYHFFHQQVHTNLTDLDLANLALKLNQNIFNLTLQKIEIPTGENPATDILYHPPKFINKQWVFIPQDPNYSSLHQFIKKSLL